MKFVSLVRTGRTFLRFHNSLSCFLFPASRIVCLSSPTQRLDILNPLSKLRSWTEFSVFLCISFFCRTLVWAFYSTAVSNLILNTRIVSNLLFINPFLVCFLKWSIVVIYKLPGSLLFCYSPLLSNVQNLFRQSKCVIFVYFGLEIPLYVKNRELNGAFFKRNMRNRDQV
jgi:hypothetical protein